MPRGENPVYSLQRWQGQEVCVEGTAMGWPRTPAAHPPHTRRLHTQASLGALSVNGNKLRVLSFMFMNLTIKP